MLIRMPRKSAGAAAEMPSVSTMGKPTEKTGVPQPPMGSRGHVLDGIVRGIPRRTHTPLVEGLVKSSCDHLKPSEGIYKVAPAATKIAMQEFGSVPYAEARLGAQK